MPRRTTSPFRKHIVFDGSLQSLWTVHQSASSILDPRYNSSLVRKGGQADPCAHSLRIGLPPTGHVALRAATPLRDHASLSLQLWVNARSTRIAAERRSLGRMRGSRGRAGSPVGFGNMAGFGHLLPGTAGHGCPCMAGHCWPWPAMGSIDWLWPALAGHGQTMPGHAPTSMASRATLTPAAQVAHSQIVFKAPSSPA